jgi:hypothetical protein
MVRQVRGYYHSALREWECDLFGRLFWPKPFGDRLVRRSGGTNRR